MAASQVIALGIGTPSDIPHFMLVGLTPTGPVAIQEAEGDVIELQAEPSAILLPSASTVVRLPADADVFLLPARRFR